MATQGRVVCGLDIGTTKVCAIIGEVAPTGELEVIGVGSVACAGLRKGVVMNIQKTIDSIRKAVEEATVSAIRAFEQRAALIAHTLGKGYRIAHMSIGDSGFQPPMPIRMRAAPAGMLADSAPAPLEGGESQVGVSISGRIDLLE